MDMTIFDIISILGGLALIFAPEWAYNFGRKGEKKEIPPKWKIISRIAGVIFVGFGVFFIYIGHFSGQ